MDQDQATSGEDRPLVSTRTMEVATGIFISALGALVAWSSYNTGAGWEAGIGPQAGYFPFWVGLFILISGVCNTVSPFLPGNKADGDAPFCTRAQMKSVLQVFVPTAIYVVLMNFIGLYAAAALYIAGFMIVNGKIPVVKTLPYAIIVPVLLYFMFEKWFLISLPKGPIEAMLGL